MSQSNNSMYNFFFALFDLTMCEIKKKKTTKERKNEKKERKK